MVMPTVSQGVVASGEAEAPSLTVGISYQSVLNELLGEGKKPLLPKLRDSVATETH